MAREFHTDVDLKGALLLNGSAGTTGQIPYSAGPGAPPVWNDPPAGGGGSVTLAASVTDVLSIATGELSADNPGADRLLFWDHSASKLTHLIPGTGLSISDTTISVAIGDAVQAYDADLEALAALTSTGLLNRTGNGTASTVTMPSGNLVGTTATQTLTNKTIGSSQETVFAIVDGTSVDLNPSNGPIQTWTLGANRAATANNFPAGASMLLCVDDGSARTLTWPTITWVGATTAPTLAITGFTFIQLWKVGSTLYGMAQK